MLLALFPQPAGGQPSLATIQGVTLAGRYQCIGYRDASLRYWDDVLLP
jgi:hypothetical protein